MDSDALKPGDPGAGPDSADVRRALVSALHLDLVGPEPGDEHEREVLPLAPSRWYLTGFLVPYEASANDRQDDTAAEQLELGAAPQGNDDDVAPEPPSARRAFFPSSMGVSLLVAKEARSLEVTVTWGDYRPLAKTERDGSNGDAEALHPAWQREPKTRTLSLSVEKAGRKTRSVEVPESGGLRLVTSVRNIPKDGPYGETGMLPKGTRSVAVFLVNDRKPAREDRKDEAVVFQATLRVRCAEPFVPRPDVRGLASVDADERVADLQYRDVCEYAVGHGVATHAIGAGDGSCREVETAWIPAAEVEKVEPAAVPGLELSMEALAACQKAEELQAVLRELPAAYSRWIARQAETVVAERRRAEVASALVAAAENVCRRIAAGVDALAEPKTFQAFRISNAAMAMAARQREAQKHACDPAAVDPPRWRPFQLAFLLMNLRGIVEPGGSERDIVDLLFFPTGGGKTEAYLGLAAFTLVHRRLANPGIASAGVAVLMRYTLRLLTLDQLSRAATLVCALERLRRDDSTLGAWPFEIGLWVGKAATPNRMGKKGDPDRETARAKTIAFKNDDRKGMPVPLESCPWCGEGFQRNSFQLYPNPDHPTDLRLVCLNRRCPFRGDNPLPVLAVDEPIYRRLPCFLIATVDKFATLPWIGHVGALLGRVERHDDQGFYGPCDPGRGSRLPAPLLPPELVIQDELHLISGPLGSMAGLYEAAIDELATRTIEGRRIRPKVVASTATVRRAQAQIRALFGRSQVEVFPPPGPDRRDSFFAHTVSQSEKFPRLYLGVAAQGRSPKVLLLRVYLALLAAGQKRWEEAGGSRAKPNPADPYMTLVGYFNSLRELGGSRRIVEDEVTHRVAGFASRLRVAEARGPFASRKLRWEVVELTSREPTHAVAEAKRRLALPFHEDRRVDVALATNMISVGLDITRLGLMVVLGQPKTAAEYIQATSRVGRDDARPGLVVTLLNIHRPRDRSHYERFEAYHGSFYRAVEASSVTPFAPRAVDRAIAAVTVSLARHADALLTPALCAAAIGSERTRLSSLAEALGRWAEGHDASLSAAEAEELRRKVKGRVKDVLDSWEKIAGESLSKAHLRHHVFGSTWHVVG